MPETKSLENLKQIFNKNSEFIKENLKYYQDKLDHLIKSEQFLIDRIQEFKEKIKKDNSNINVLEEIISRIKSGISFEVEQIEKNIDRLFTDEQAKQSIETSTEEVSKDGLKQSELDASDTNKDKANVFFDNISKILTDNETQFESTIKSISEHYKAEIVKIHEKRKSLLGNVEKFKTDILQLEDNNQVKTIIDNLKEEKIESFCSTIDKFIDQEDVVKFIDYIQIDIGQIVDAIQEFNGTLTASKEQFKALVTEYIKELYKSNIEEINEKRKLLLENVESFKTDILSGLESNSEVEDKINNLISNLKEEKIEEFFEGLSSTIDKFIDQEDAGKFIGDIEEYKEGIVDIIKQVNTTFAENEQQFKSAIQGITEHYKAEIDKIDKKRKSLLGNVEIFKTDILQLGSNDEVKTIIDNLKEEKTEGLHHILDKYIEQDDTDKFIYDIKSYKSEIVDVIKQCRETFTNNVNKLNDFVIEHIKEICKDEINKVSEIGGKIKSLLNNVQRFKTDILQLEDNNNEVDGIIVSLQEQRIEEHLKDLNTIISNPVDQDGESKIISDLEEYKVRIVDVVGQVSGILTENEQQFKSVVVSITERYKAKIDEINEQRKSLLENIETFEKFISELKLKNEKDKKAELNSIRSIVTNLEEEIGKQLHSTISEFIGQDDGSKFIYDVEEYKERIVDAIGKINKTVTDNNIQFITIVKKISKIYQDKKDKIHERIESIFRDIEDFKKNILTENSRGDPEVTDIEFKITSLKKRMDQSFCAVSEFINQDDPGKFIDDIEIYKNEIEDINYAHHILIQEYKSFIIYTIEEYVKNYESRIESFNKKAKSICSNLSQLKNKKSIDSNVINDIEKRINSLIQDCTSIINTKLDKCVPSSDVSIIKKSRKEAGEIIYYIDNVFEDIDRHVKFINDKVEYIDNTEIDQQVINQVDEQICDTFSKIDRLLTNAESMKIGKIQTSRIDEILHKYKGILSERLRIFHDIENFEKEYEVLLLKSDPFSKLFNSFYDMSYEFNNYVKRLKKLLSNSSSDQSLNNDECDELGSQNIDELINELNSKFLVIEKIVLDIEKTFKNTKEKYEQSHRKIPTAKGENSGIANDVESNDSSSSFIKEDSSVQSDTKKENKVNVAAASVSGAGNDSSDAPQQTSDSTPQITKTVRFDDDIRSYNPSYLPTGNTQLQTTKSADSNTTNDKIILSSQYIIKVTVILLIVTFCIISLLSGINAILVNLLPIMKVGNSIINTAISAAVCFVSILIVFCLSVYLVKMKNKIVEEGTGRVISSTNDTALSTESRSKSNKNFITVTVIGYVAFCIFLAVKFGTHYLSTNIPTVDFYIDISVLVLAALVIAIPLLVCFISTCTRNKECVTIEENHQEHLVTSTTSHGVSTTLHSSELKSKSSTADSDKSIVEEVKKEQHSI